MSIFNKVSNIENNYTAIAKIEGVSKNAQIHGIIYLKELNNGVVLTGEINGLPTRNRRK